MKRHWDEQELAERWSLTHDECELVRNRTERSRLGFTVLLKFFQVDARFPVARGEIPDRVLDYLAGQLDVPRGGLDALVAPPMPGKGSAGDRSSKRWTRKTQRHGPSKARSRKAAVHREQRRPATERNDIWSMDCYLSLDEFTGAAQRCRHPGHTR